MKRETRQLRGVTKVTDRIRTEVIDQAADDAMEFMAAQVNGKGAEFVIDFIRAVARKLAIWLAVRAGQIRCVGIFSGAISHACPGWSPSIADNRAQAEALFSADELREVA